MEPRLARPPPPRPRGGSELPRAPGLPALSRGFGLPPEFSLSALVACERVSQTLGGELPLRPQLPRPTVNKESWRMMANVCLKSSCSARGSELLTFELRKSQQLTEEQ